VINSAQVTLVGEALQCFIDGATATEIEKILCRPNLIGWTAANAPSNQCREGDWWLN
jgi:hypothetical protein